MEINTTITELEQAVYTALETYSNVHRGSGHFSMVSTHLYEQARRIVLEYLGLNKNDYTVIFCSPRRAGTLKSTTRCRKLPAYNKQRNRTFPECCCPGS